MIRAIRELGRLYPNTELDKLPEGHLIIIELSSTGGTLQFDQVSIEEIDLEKIKNYLYKKGTPNGPNFSPTAIITEPEKTFDVKVIGWFRRIMKDFSGKPDLQNHLNYVKKIQDCLDQNSEKILSEIKNKISEYKKSRDHSFSITIKIDQKYIGEIQEFQELFKAFLSHSFSGKSFQEEALCSLCGKKGEVSGSVGVFKFYTLDKPGFIAGGFKEEFAWRNFPVCRDCQFHLESGRKYIEDNLVFNFYGLKYWIIPKFYLARNDDEKREILRTLASSSKNQTMQNRKRITSDQREILDILSQSQDYLGIDIIFIEQEKSAERILLHIEDIFPSRLRKIFEAKDKIDDIFSEVSDQRDFNLEALRLFFSKTDKSKREYDLNNYFLDIVAKIFRGGRVQIGFLLKFFMKSIRDEFIRDSTRKRFLQLTEDSLKLLLFLHFLEIVEFASDYNKNTNMGIFEGFFNKYSPVFDSPHKKALFLLGALTQLLLNVQMARGKIPPPFLKKLKSLKMSKKDVIALFPELKNKLFEYGVSYRKIEEECTRYFLESGDWNMSVDELNFYFVCGMNSAQQMKKIIEEDKQDGTQ
ncbi:MAG: TIGR02556 family CRISPR-associated protein [Candidatus Calescibacterium sp.]|nr:TIGR02556 family CRISPR-associated protein [Candidatus Calescibacterium sp.]MDW8087432.1 TIGR02556 family CRISPR-associated protein [Candidatus Calescibacterium sp.]